MCKQRSFCANGCPATLLMNCSSPFRRSSMKSSSNRPSSPRNGICRFQALPGSGGTTILLSRSSSLRNHSKSEYRRRTLDSFNLKIGKFDCEHPTRSCFYMCIGKTSKQSVNIVCLRVRAGVKGADSWRQRRHTMTPRWRQMWRDITRRNTTRHDTTPLALRRPTRRRAVRFALYTPHVARRIAHLLACELRSRCTVSARCRV